MVDPRICVLQTDGTNCDKETAFAFNLVGGNAEVVHINSLINGYDPVSQQEKFLDNYHILAIPGGFSHGDYLSAGKVFAFLLQNKLGHDVTQFIRDGKPIIGICNGFQVLVKYGLLPRIDDHTQQTVTLTYNEHGKFEDRMSRLVSPGGLESRCIWTKGILSIDLPIAHGEGRFVTDEATYACMLANNQIVFQYANSRGIATQNFPENPNGSMHAVAGICDPTGLIFGLMPHPERYREPENHALFTIQKILCQPYVEKKQLVEERRRLIGDLPREGNGLQILRNGVEYARHHLL